MHKASQNCRFFFPQFKNVFISICGFYVGNKMVFNKVFVCLTNIHCIDEVFYLTTTAHIIRNLIFF